MGMGKRVLVVGLVGLLAAVGVGAFWWMGRTVDAAPAPPAKAASVARPTSPVTVPPASLAQKPEPPVFSPAELKRFLAEVAKAEAIADPLQRCLAYPDPPRSHWSPASVKAYCQYRLQSTISFDQAQQLIRSGHAAELDRRLAEALQAQLTRPESAGLLDQTYFNAFDNGSFDVRTTLDAWKRASPNSAFALAASGFAYVAMAADARGDAFIQDTPQSNIDAMDRLLRLADADLQRAATLDPRVTPTYIAMINAGSFALGDDYVIKAARIGLKQAPADYAIYGLMSHATEPKWGGSLQAMKAIARLAQAHVKENPLLAILQSAEPLVEYDVCNCHGSANWQAFTRVFDNLGSTQELFAAGNAANANRRFDLAVVYLSEGLRFAPNAYMAHSGRDAAASNLGETAFVLDDATRWIRQLPDRPWGYAARGYAYEVQGDEAHAVADLQRASELDPRGMYPLVQMADIYLDSREWDKALGVADRMVRIHPELPSGWVVRAIVQRATRSPGLEDTARYFLAHFGNVPDQQRNVHMIQVMVARRAEEKRRASAAEAAGKGNSANQ